MEKTDVIICGGGPTGVLLSALLSRLRVANVVLERESGVTTDPRGIALDEDGIRALQAVGIYDKIFREIGSSMLKFNFITGVHSNLYKKPMMAIDNSTSEGGTGHVGFLCHKQPEMEKALRSSIQKSQFSQLRPSCLVTQVVDDGHSVKVQFNNAEGCSISLSGKFVVGADGKTGFVRKNYLEPQGVKLQKCQGTDYDEVWVALNLKIVPPNDTTHPEFPLWQLGHSPEDVYNLFFPQDFRFLCNPERPAVCGRFGLTTDRLWRFEFVVYKHEDGTEMASEKNTMAIILPYLTHPGAWYGLPGSVSFPVDCIEILRSRPFSFQARSCNRWSLGRVMLTGDAAHVFPPFGGQGIASGFRDAMSLAWRLALLTRNPDCDYEKVLEAWYVERKQQFEDSLAATIKNGDLVNESSVIKSFIRDWYFWALQMIPKWRRQLEQGPRAQGLTRYAYREGLPFSVHHCGGRLLPQSYVWDLETQDLAFSDDLLFSARKTSMFQLLILSNSAEEVSTLVAAVNTTSTSDLISAGEATVIIQTLQKPTNLQSATTLGVAHIAHLATGDEFATHSLCKNRPAPRYYDPFRMRRDLGDVNFVVVRPDRFVYAACEAATELAEVLKGISSVVLPQK